MSSSKSHEKGASKIGPVALIAIIVGDVLVLAIVSLLLYCYFWRNYKLKEGKGSKLFESEKIVYSSSPYPAQGGFERGRMVFFEGEKRFELEDLLRASAEMLGKGGFGTAYKAVLDDGNVVAVKRLKDAQITGKREFEQHMEVLGRLRHPNVVSLRAYYFAREEKLLVYDYMPNATLFWLLHGTSNLPTYVISFFHLHIHGCFCLYVTGHMNEIKQKFYIFCSLVAPQFKSGLSALKLILCSYRTIATACVCSFGFSFLGGGGVHLRGSLNFDDEPCALDGVSLFMIPTFSLLATL